MKWKKTSEIKDELFEAGWRDDTLSPLSEQPYWNLCKEMVQADEKVLSILFAKSMPTTLLQKKYLFIITETGLIYRSDYGGYISNPKKVPFQKIQGIELFEDKYLPSFIYIDFNFSPLKTLHLQTFDPTGLYHFQEAFLNKK